MAYDNNVFGRNLRRIRRAADVTQEQLAEATGIGTGVITRYETGITVPGLDKVYVLACALGCTIDELAGLHEEVA